MHSAGHFCNMHGRVYNNSMVTVLYCTKNSQHNISNQREAKQTLNQAWSEYKHSLTFRVRAMLS